MAQQNLVEKNESSHVLQKIVDDFNAKYKKWLDQSTKRESSWKNLIPCFSSDGNSVAGIGDSSAAPTGGSSTGNDGSGGKGQSKERLEATTSHLPSHAIHGFENEILALKHFLLNQKNSDEFKTLAVVGRPGVGKSALCQVIFNDQDVKKAYVPRIWVSMSGEPGEDRDRKTTIVKRILENLGVEKETFVHIKKDAEHEKGEEAEAGRGGGETVEEKELSRLLYALYLNLWGKKYLIVLDDGRKEDGWNETLHEERPKGKKWGTHLLYGFPKGSGGRVIFTSRDEELAMKLVGKEENLHRLYPLSDPDSCWKIYIEAAEENKIEVKPRNKRKSQQDLMNKSAGIPLVARMMGKIKPVDKDEPSESSGQTGSSHGKADQKNLEQEGTDTTNAKD